MYRPVAWRRSCAAGRRRHRREPRLAPGARRRRPGSRPRVSSYSTDRAKEGELSVTEHNFCKRLRASTHTTLKVRPGASCRGSAQVVGTGRSVRSGGSVARARWSARLGAWRTETQPGGAAARGGSLLSVLALLAAAAARGTAAAAPSAARALVWLAAAAGRLL